jgi:hypothetical protein
MEAQGQKLDFEIITAPRSEEPVTFPSVTG